MARMLDLKERLANTDVLGPKPLVAIPLESFLALDLPPRKNLLSPWLPEKGIAMLYAPRGVGKTHFALNVAYAIASGGAYLRWKADQPRRVLLLDGEMPAVVLQERLAMIARISPTEPPEGHIRVLAYDLLDMGGPDLSTEEGHKALEPVIGDAELIIVDNLSTICRQGRENEAESWAMVQAWALAQRRAGRSVLFVHHAGKNGDQRGTSKKEDVMDTVIRLCRPVDYLPTQGARFVVEFTKARGFTGMDADGFEANLTDGVWETCEIGDAELNQVMDFHDQGMKQRAIASMMGISVGKANYLVKRGLEARKGG